MKQDLWNLDFSSEFSRVVLNRIDSVFGTFYKDSRNLLWNQNKVSEFFWKLCVCASERTSFLERMTEIRTQDLKVFNPRKMLSFRENPRKTTNLRRFVEFWTQHLYFGWSKICFRPNYRRWVIFTFFRHFSTLLCSFLVYEKILKFWEKAPKRIFSRKVEFFVNPENFFADSTHLNSIHQSQF